MRRALLVTALAVSSALWPVGGASSHPGHQAQRVAVSGYTYLPAEVELVTGDSVNWVWEGAVTNHTVTADPGQAESFESDPGVPAGSVQHAAGDNFVDTFYRAGRFTYSCRVHPFMRGTIVVRDPFPPRFLLFAVSPERFCTAPGCRFGRLRVSLSEEAVVRGRIQQRSGGAWKTVRRVGPLRLPTGRSSRRLPLAGLRPGSYRLAGRAVDSAGNHSRRIRLASFRIDQVS